MESSAPIVGKAVLTLETHQHAAVHVAAGMREH